MAQWHNADVPVEMISPFAMPPPQYNTLGPDLSAQMARSQLMHRLSTRSSTASNASKRGSARISKLGSTGSSPHYISRRRTTAAHSGRPYETSRLSGEQKLWTLHGSRPASNNIRPFSWHPASVPIQTTPENASYSEHSMGSAISGFENLTVTNPSHSTGQQSIQDDFAMGYENHAQTGPLYQQYIQPHYSGIGSDLQNVHHPYLSDSYNEPLPIQPMRTYPSPAYSMHQWPSSSNLSMDPIATLAPATRLEYSPDYLQTKELPHTPEHEGDELVGIGLYDNTNNGPMFTQATEARTEPSTMKGGKDLKLEETWQPPSHDDEEQDGESGDDIDEAEDMPEEEPNGRGGQTTMYPTYDDLSNQSFLFMDEVDPLPNVDQYNNYHIFNNDIRGLNLGMDKPHPIDLGNAPWF